MISVMTGRRARWIGNTLGFPCKVKNKFTGRSWLDYGIEKIWSQVPERTETRVALGKQGPETTGQSFQGTIVMFIKLQSFPISVKHQFPGTDSVTGREERWGGGAL